MLLGVFHGEFKPQST